MLQVQIPGGRSDWLFAFNSLRDLIVSKHHSISTVTKRANLIVDRVRLVATVFAVLTVAWILVDAIVIPWPEWGELALGRIVASSAFAALALVRFDKANISAGLLALGCLLATPLLFYFFSSSVLGEAQGNGASLTVVAAYYFLPFIVASGLAIFPLTALESGLFAAPILLTAAASIFIWPGQLSLDTSISSIWRLFLIIGISSLAGMSQLRFLILLNEQAMRDGLTSLLVRKVGEEVLAHQLSIAERNNQPFSVLLVDLDNFKQVNDQFGHEAGDAVLRSAASKLTARLRRQDIAIRWGGEEFLIALPDTDMAGAERLIRHLSVAGIGGRPDRHPLTASIGVSERREDAIGSLDALVALADRRMYSAKSAGRNCYILHEEPVRWLQLASTRFPKVDSAA